MQMGGWEVESCGLRRSCRAGYQTSIFQSKVTSAPAARSTQGLSVIAPNPLTSHGAFGFSGAWLAWWPGCRVQSCSLLLEPLLYLISGFQSHSPSDLFFIPAIPLLKPHSQTFVSSRSYRTYRYSSYYSRTAELDMVSQPRERCSKQECPADIPCLLV